MQLLTCRIIGHPAIASAPWLKVGGGFNLLKSDSAAQATALLRMLETINPPYPLRQHDPFALLPAYWSDGLLRRNIVPAKKTAALAVFAATPALVRALTAIDPAFYETDRIEAGRRRDYSLWINFVELSGSGRWSDIAPDICALLEATSPDAAAAATALRAFAADRRGTDRLRGETAARLTALLQALRPGLAEVDLARLAQCLVVIDQAHRFLQGKEVVRAHLPPFFLVWDTASSPAPFHPGATTGESSPEAGARILARMTDLARRQLDAGGSPPIFLLDLGGLDGQPEEQEKLLTLFLQGTRSWQSLVAPPAASADLWIDRIRQAAAETISGPTLVDLSSAISAG